MTGNHTDMSDVLISWGKSPMFWLVVLIVVVSPLAILDNRYSWGVVASISDFFVSIADVLKSAFMGIA